MPFSFCGREEPVEQLHCAAAPAHREAGAAAVAQCNLPMRTNLSEVTVSTVRSLAADESVGVVEDVSPRQVIRGENPSKEEIKEHSRQPNPDAAFVDWLNFSFPYIWESGKGTLDLDKRFFKAFGFGLKQNRGRGHLNYEQSWVLGEEYGIFATGGKSVGGTSFVSLSGLGCAAVKNWTEVYYLLKELHAKITRIDLAHDDFLGKHGVLEAKAWWEAGLFNAKHGRPPKGKILDDLGSDNGKTFYLGSRESGKLLRVYEKGKQLGDPSSPWVRWECELHNVDRLIKTEVVTSPGTHLAGSYPCLGWIYPRQSRIDTIRKTAEIGLDVLTDSCKKSYGKLFYVMRGLGMTDTQIVEMLIREGFPKRLDLPYPELEEA